MSPADGVVAELARFFAGQPIALERALRQHQDDGRGSCRVCVAGGQRGNLPWPCTTYAAASLARRRGVGS